MNKELRFITHSGRFHTDDVFAIAVLSLYFKDTPHTVTRTRDKKVIETGDYVVDVGDVYDAERGRFDHHQEGGAGVRENGIPYSSFGLVWKEFGEKLCDSRDIAEIIEKRLVYPIDMADTGIQTYMKASEFALPYLIHNVTGIFRPTWKEEENGRSFDDGFMEMVDIAKKIILREIKTEKDREEGEVFVQKAYNEAEDKQIIVLDGSYPWEGVLKNFSEPLYVVKPSGDEEGGWSIKAVRTDPDASFENRKDMPKEWGGKRGDELAKVTGVPDATFCHNKLFNAGAKTKAGALRLARLAVENKE